MGRKNRKRKYPVGRLNLGTPNPAPINPTPTTDSRAISGGYQPNDSIETEPPVETESAVQPDNNEVERFIEEVEHEAKQDNSMYETTPEVEEPVEETPVPNDSVPEPVNDPTGQAVTTPDKDKDNRPNVSEAYREAVAQHAGPTPNTSAEAAPKSYTPNKYMEPNPNNNIRIFNESKGKQTPQVSIGKELDKQLAKLSKEVGKMVGEQPPHQHGPGCAHEIPPILDINPIYVNRQYGGPGVPKNPKKVNVVTLQRLITSFHAENIDFDDDIIRLGRVITTLYMSYETPITAALFKETMDTLFYLSWIDMKNATRYRKIASVMVHNYGRLSDELGDELIELCTFEPYDNAESTSNE